MKETIPGQITRRSLLLGTAAFGLTACSLPNLKDIVGPPAPLQLYVLRPTLPAPPAGGAAVRWQLTIPVPDAPASLDSVRIALSPTATKLDYFADASWTDRAPLLMQGYLVEAFGARRVPVARDTAGLLADYVLYTELRDFQAEYNGTIPPAPPPDKDKKDEPAPPPAGPPPTVAVQMVAKLMAVPTRRVIGTFEASAKAMAQANAVESIVMAFNQASGDALNQVVDWTLRTAPPA
jgi:cholesterol transport system auxiliary component